LEGRQIWWPCASTWLHLSRKQDRHRRGQSITDDFRHINHQPDQTHDHELIIAELAGTEIRQSAAESGDSGSVKATTVAEDPAEAKATIHSLSGRRQPTGLAHSVAPVVVSQPTTTKTKVNSMKPIIRYRSQMLFRQSIQPKRILRIRPAKLNFIFRPVRFGVKP